MTRGGTAAHRPITGGSPATPAYASTWGIRYALTVRPASRSLRSQDRWYRRISARLGS
jgi:hypothetical protein